MSHADLNAAVGDAVAVRASGHRKRRRYGSGTDSAAEEQVGDVISRHRVAGERRRTADVQKLDAVVGVRDRAVVDYRGIGEREPSQRRSVDPETRAVLDD